MPVLLVNGPNLNTLGRREPEVYGTDTLPDVVARGEKRAIEIGASITTFQSNHGGAIIDFIQEQQDGADGLIINPGSLGHTSYALRDCIAGSGLPTVEADLSNIPPRERFR